MLSSMTTSAAFAFFFCFLFTIPNFHVCFCNGISSSSNHTHHNNITCFENEREALLKFKQDLIDPMKRLSSWDIGEDCCKWTGVVCDNFTGHVREIRLRNPYDQFSENYTEYEAYLSCRLGGKLNPSLLDLKHLQYLDLSNNDFKGAHIPSFIGSIATLRYLNLSEAGFSGTIPPQLGNVTTMRYLDLRYNGRLLCGNLQWLSRLVLLQHLDISGVNLSKALDWLQVTSNLSSLVELHLSDCGLEYIVSLPPQLGNVTTVRYLDLQYNDRLLCGNLQWLSHLVLLQHLDMSGVNLSKALDWLEVTSNLPSLVELHLSGCGLKYVVSPSSTNKINFTSLDVIDLSNNNLGSSVPGWILSLNHLVSIDLSDCSFKGPLPSGPQNMTSLRVLNWSYNNFNSTIPNWLYSLSHLESLNLNGNRLHGAVSIAIENLTSLVSLDLSGNQLQGSIPTSLGKLCRLKTIDLSRNKFSGEVADIFVGFSRCKSNELETFYSWGNYLLGHLPYELGQLTSLAYFDLYGNSFSGPIPASIGRLSSLISLFLSNNKFNGTLPESFGRLGKLEGLYISHNLLEGVVSDVHFASLTKLRYLSARGNSLTLKASENWVPPFQLENLNLDSWQLGTQFPLWLPSQRKLQYLSIANTRISESIPTWFWPSFPNLGYVNLSRNQIRGEISSLRNVRYLSVIDLSSNHFSGTLPLLPSNLRWLDLSNNFFSRSIYHVLCGKGEEPNNVMSFLNLGDNLLSGKIPDCWKHPNLLMIKLENNNLAGSIPNSIGQLSRLQSLHLQHNNLSGELPRTLQNCSFLQVIDLSENRFAGSIPPWIGNSFLTLIDLNLRSNKFSGDLPDELCRLSSLQILDVAHNNLSGPVPRCFANFSAMAEINNSRSSIFYDIGYGITDNLFLVTKGRYVEYSTTLGLVTSMDLSRNNLSGEIPEELTKLRGLWSLNLSDNHLKGKIPRNIGDMRQLESLDFSLNQLSGEIPSSISSLTFLSHLNLSYNNLMGSIPSSTQLQSMNDSSFLGNKLCGPPLTSYPKKPAIPPQVDPPGSEENGEGSSEALFFAIMALGFAVGFWIVLGPLLFKRSWRITYFRVLEDIWHKLWDFIS